MRTILAMLLAATWASGANPLFHGADPHAVIFDKQLWIYPTGGGRGSEFIAWSSKNLTQWEKHGPVFSLHDAPWVTQDGAPHHSGWAPCVIAEQGKYYFYYSVGPQNPTPSRIGVAVGNSPTGPFTDSGKPLLTGGDGFEAIDPFVFKDPQSEKFYLYAGGSAGAKLRVFELQKDLISITREIPVETPKKFTEGVFMHYWAGRYYLSYSHGSWKNDTYSVHYSSSKSATGPWVYQGAILTSDAQHKGPGHHSLVFLPGTKQWLIIYHCWDHRQGDGPYSGAREVCIDRLEHAADGTIRPVVMSDTGVSL